MSLVCESFGCRPSEARWELENDPDELVLRILDLRAYAHAKATIDAAKDKTDLRMTPMIQTVWRITQELLAPPPGAER